MHSSWWLPFSLTASSLLQRRSARGDECPLVRFSSFMIRCTSRLFLDRARRASLPGCFLASSYRPVRCHWHDHYRCAEIFFARSHMSRVRDHVALSPLRSNCSRERNVPAEKHSRSLIDEEHEDSRARGRMGRSPWRCVLVVGVHVFQARLRHIWRVDASDRGVFCWVCPDCRKTMVSKSQADRVRA